MSKLLRSKLFWAGVVVLGLVVVIAVGVAALAASGPRIRNHSYLVLDLRSGMMDYDPPADLVAQLMGPSPLTLQRTLENLAKAAADSRVDGVILKLGLETAIGGASRQELREAIREVRDQGKPVIAWAESLMSGGVHLAAACDRVVLPPTGMLVFTGTTAQSLHIKGMLEKLGITADLHQIKDYKSAAEMMTRTDSSGPARENRQWLLDEMWQMTMADMEQDRGLTETRLLQLMEHALFTPEEAQEAGLIDAIAYWDELVAELKREQDEELRTVRGGTYAKVSPRSVGLRGRKQVAVVYAQGTIAGRKSGFNPLLGMTMGHESVIADLRRAEKDPKVAAVVFRVDSPGGSALTSDLIARQIDTMKQVKPVVVSMGDVAASGGYVVAYRADRIVASPMTITGSIGSISGKFDMKGLYDKLGISFDSVSKGPMAELFSGLRRFTPEERARFQDNHWKSYNRWIADVAQRRGMAFEEVDQLAQGRVWSGRQARAHGLIDDVGGLRRAVELAKELADIPADERVTLVHLPGKKGLLELLTQQDGNQASALISRLFFNAVQRDLAEAARILADDSWLMEPMVID